MSMRVKIVAVLAASAAAILLADAMIERLVVLPKFVALERREAELNLDRVAQALDRELDQLARAARNYGVWDDAWQFLQTRSPEFVKSNLAPDAFATLRLNLMHYYDLEGKLVWGETRSASDGTPISIPDLNPSDFAPQTLLRASDGRPASLHGLLPVGDNLVLVASSPVLTSDGKGPARGTVVFARLLTARDQWRLREQTSVSFSLLPERGAGTTSGDGRELPPGGIAFDESRRDTLLASRWLSDIHGRPVRLLRVDLPRQITQQGRAVLRDETLWMLLAILALVLVVYGSLGRMVVGPVHRLIRHVLWIRQSGDLSNRIGIRSSDEVGALAREFDLMLTQLARSQAARVRSEKQLKAVLRDHPDLIRRFTPDGMTTFVNRAYARLFGTTEECLIGRKGELPTVDEDRAGVEAHLAALSTACPVTEVDHRVRLPSGEVRWLHWTTRAIFDAEGNVIEVQSVGRDVTRQMGSGSPGAASAVSNAVPLVLDRGAAAPPANAPAV